MSHIGAELACVIKLPSPPLIKLTDRELERWRVSALLLSFPIFSMVTAGSVPSRPADQLSTISTSKLPAS
jgi:hypothetical protein